MQYLKNIFFLGIHIALLSILGGAFFCRRLAVKKLRCILLILFTKIASYDKYSCSESC